MSFILLMAKYLETTILRSRLNPTPFPHDAPRWWIRDGNLVAQDLEAVRGHRDMLRKLLEDRSISENYTVKVLSEKLDRIVIDALRSRPQDIKDWVTVHLSEFLRDLRSPIRRWNVVVPLEGIVLQGVSRLRIGRVTLQPFSSSHFTKHSANLWKIIRRNLKYDRRQKAQLIKLDRTHYLRPLVGKLSAFVSVQSRDDLVADRAEDATRVVLNVLRLYRYMNDDFYRIYPNLLGEGPPLGIRNVLAYNSRGTVYRPSIQRVGRLYDYIVDEKRVRWMRRSEVATLNAILKGKLTDELGQLIIVAINWFGHGVSLPVSADDKVGPPLAHHPHNVRHIPAGLRFLALFAALETLLIFGWETDLTEKVAKRVALLLGRNRQGRMAVFRQTKTLYKLRGDIVHHGMDNVSPEESDRLAFYSQLVIHEILRLKRTRRFTEHIHVKRWLDSRPWP